jgi:hypothetical protein
VLGIRLSLNFYFVGVPDFVGDPDGVLEIVIDEDTVPDCEGVRDGVPEPVRVPDCEGVFEGVFEGVVD